MRRPSLADRLSMANAAKQARLERAKRLAEDPERAERLKARDEIVAARNRRISEREAERRAAQERQAAELAAKEAAKLPLARPNAKTERKLRRNGWPNRPKEKPGKPPNGRQSSPPAEPAGKRRSGKGIRDSDDGLLASLAESCRLRYGAFRPASVFTERQKSDWRDQCRSMARMPR
jgi:hypothetical protein